MITKGAAPLTGTVNDDILINSGAGADVSSGGALVGAEGNDMLLDDYEDILVTPGGTSLGTALDLDSLIGLWRGGPNWENAIVNDASVPTITIGLQAIAGQSSYFKIEVPAGATLSFDIDGASGFGSNTIDPCVSIYDFLGNFAFDFDDSDADIGSNIGPNNRTSDSAGTWTNQTNQTQTIYLRVGSFGIPVGEDNTDVFADSAEFLLHVSLTGHGYNSAPQAASGGTLNGGVGDDFIAGAAGDDSIFAGTGQDTVYAGSGTDVVYIANTSGHFDGGSGIDTLDFNAISGLGAVTVDLSMGTASADGLTATVAGFEWVRGTSQGDTITGSVGADRLQGEFGDDTLTGGEGDDTLYGGFGNDTLYDREGDDLVFGDEGNDHFYTGQGTNTLNGGEGDDSFVIIYGSGLNTIIGGAGYDRFYNSHASGDVFNFIKSTYTRGTTVLTMNSIEAFYDGDGASTIVTAQYAYSDLVGTYYPNLYKGNGGDDVIFVSNLVTGSQTVEGGDGNDRVVMRDNQMGDFDSIDGGAGIDTLVLAGMDLEAAGNPGPYRFYLGTGAFFTSYGNEMMTNFENVVGTNSADIISGTGQDNNMQGAGGDDELNGETGNDVLIGNGGDDNLRGDDGNDFLNGGEGGIDLMQGGAGDDTYVIYDANDLIFETAGDGNDTVNTWMNYTIGINLENANVATTAGLTINGNGVANRIIGNVGNDTFTGGNGNDILNGQGGNDTLSGNDGDDYILGGDGGDAIFGGAGADIVKGDAGDDTVRGGDGADNVFGGAGRDFLYGDGGADFFLFATGDSAATRANADVIGDFSKAAGDKLHLGGVDAKSTVAGDQAFAFIGTSAFTNVAGQLRYEQVSGNTYVEGDVNGDGVADFILRLNGTHTLAASDFVL